MGWQDTFSTPDEVYRFPNRQYRIMNLHLLYFNLCLLIIDVNRLAPGVGLLEAIQLLPTHATLGSELEWKQMPMRLRTAISWLGFLGFKCAIFEL